MRTLIIFVFLLLTQSVWAWGGRGHHAICHSAVFLLKEKGLKTFLRSRPHTMGHLCNIPDIYWKNSGPEQNKIGSPTHWIDPEVIGLKLVDVPTNYKKIISKYTGKKNHFEPEKTIASIPAELGSVWWRADQFWQRAVKAGKEIKRSKAPKDKKEEQNEALPYNQATYDFMVNLGLLGHFVGDSSQPFHVTVDHDGYFAGHGGIHWFYEDGNMDAQDESVETQLIQVARQLQAMVNSKDKTEKNQVKFLTAKNKIEQMRQLTMLSSNDIPALLQIDQLTKPSELASPQNNNTRKPAQRLTPDETAAAYLPYITKHMGRSAALLAAMWDEAYVKAGRPDLSAYRSFRYPLSPEFVPPDYYDLKTANP